MDSSGLSVEHYHSSNQRCDLCPIGQVCFQPGDPLLYASSAPEQYQGHSIIQQQQQQQQLLQQQQQQVEEVSFSDVEAILGNSDDELNCDLIDGELLNSPVRPSTSIEPEVTLEEADEEDDKLNIDLIDAQLLQQFNSPERPSSSLEEGAGTFEEADGHLPPWISCAYGGRKPGLHFKPGRFPLDASPKYWFTLWYDRSLGNCSWKDYTAQVRKLANELGDILDTFFSSKTAYKPGRPDMSSTGRHQLAALVEAKYPALADKYEEFARRYFQEGDTLGTTISASTFEWPTFSAYFDRKLAQHFDSKPKDSNGTLVQVNPASLRRPWMSNRMKQSNTERPRRQKRQKVN